MSGNLGLTRKLGLYIHIPFCVRKCGYCDFLSAPASEEERERYVSSLVREMGLWGELGLRGDVERCKELGLRGDVERCKEPGLRGNTEWCREAASDFEVDTVFIGGGTPSVLSAAQMDRVFQGIADYFPLGENPEFTVECNPGTVTAEKLAAYRRAGVNRVSFGMQSAHDEELVRLGRIHTFRDFETSYEQARKAGFSNINIDVMAAIPGQTEKSYEETLFKVISLAPEHISSYSLIIEEGTPFYEKYAENPPVDEETDRQMYELTGEMLAGAGYERYEISNYAREGFMCRHNLKYWRREEYLALGRPPLWDAAAFPTSGRCPSMKRASRRGGCRWRSGRSSLPTMSRRNLCTWAFAA